MYYPQQGMGVYGGGQQSFFGGPGAGFGGARPNFGMGLAPGSQPQPPMTGNAGPINFNGLTPGQNGGFGAGGPTGPIASNPTALPPGPITSPLTNPTQSSPITSPLAPQSPMQPQIMTPAQQPPTMQPQIMRPPQQPMQPQIMRPPTQMPSGQMPLANGGGAPGTTGYPMGQMGMPQNGLAAARWGMRPWQSAGGWGGGMRPWQGGGANWGGGGWGGGGWGGGGMRQPMTW